MSEITHLSNNYEVLADVSEQLNEAILTLRKQTLATKPSFVKSYPAIVVSDAEVNNAKEYIIHLLKNFNTASPNDLDSTQKRIVDNLKKKYSQEDFKTKTVEATIHAIERNKALSDPNFKFLDSLLSVVDNERSVVFRKLRNRH